jgi:hypothetical protein
MTEQLDNVTEMKLIEWKIERMERAFLKIVNNIDHRLNILEDNVREK